MLSRFPPPSLNKWLVLTLSAFGISFSRIKNRKRTYVRPSPAELLVYGALIEIGFQTKLFLGVKARA